MTPHPLIIVALFIFLYSLIQSVFGVGVLLFGTPTLLLLGYSFDQALSYLLPCSIAINLMQIWGNLENLTLKRDFIFFSLPFVAVGLWVVLEFNYSLNIRKYVGLLMILTALIRISQSLRQSLSHYGQKHLKASLVVIGAVHGLTNMGGGLLSLLVSSIYSEKKKIRANIAFGYLMMALCQLAVLGWTGHRIFGWERLCFIAVALISFLLIGNRVYLISSELNYQKILTLFISIFGLTLLLT